LGLTFPENQNGAGIFPEEGPFWKKDLPSGSSMGGMFQEKVGKKRFIPTLI
jgi:hypothetical protein